MLRQTNAEGETFEPAQYETLAGLCDALRSQLPIAAVAGHEHVAPGRKLDPGPGFDWRALQQRLAWADACFPEVVLAGHTPRQHG